MIEYWNIFSGRLEDILTTGEYLNMFCSMNSKKTVHVQRMDEVSRKAAQTGNARTGI